MFDGALRREEKRTDSVPSSESSQPAEQWIDQRYKLGKHEEKVIPIKGLPSDPRELLDEVGANATDVKNLLKGLDDLDTPEEVRKVA